MLRGATNGGSDDEDLVVKFSCGVLQREWKQNEHTSIEAIYTNFLPLISLMADHISGALP
jgi:hypothetical protein